MCIHTLTALQTHTQLLPMSISTTLKNNQMLHILKDIHGIQSQDITTTLLQLQLIIALTQKKLNHTPSMMPHMLCITTQQL
jgi:hypothetical protein